MQGVLYVVATPIGNLDDISLRAAKTLEQADFIAAEDTRVTVKLLNHLGVKKPMVSYYQHNLEAQGAKIIARIAAGEVCALCCDAGTPAISDPGQVLVAQAHKAGIKVVPIPGASAFVAALSAGGQATGRFVFEGFLSTNKGQRAGRLAALHKEARTIVFYEAPHKLPATLKDMAAAFGEERSVTVAREITKLHEEIYVTTLGEAAKRYSEVTPKGEFVLLVAGAQVPDVEKESTLEDAVAFAAELMAKGQKIAGASKNAAAATGFAKGDIYKGLLALGEQVKN